MRLNLLLIAIGAQVHRTIYSATTAPHSSISPTANSQDPEGYGLEIETIVETYRFKKGSTYDPKSALTVTRTVGSMVFEEIQEIEQVTQKILPTNAAQREARRRPRGDVLEEIEEEIDILRVIRRRILKRIRILIGWEEREDQREQERREREWEQERRRERQREQERQREREEERRDEEQRRRREDERRNEEQRRRREDERRTEERRRGGEQDRQRGRERGRESRRRGGTIVIPNVSTTGGEENVSLTSLDVPRSPIPTSTFGPIENPSPPTPTPTIGGDAPTSSQEIPGPTNTIGIPEATITAAPVGEQIITTVLTVDGQPTTIPITVTPGGFGFQTITLANGQVTVIPIFLPNPNILITTSTVITAGTLTTTISLTLTPGIAKTATITLEGGQTTTLTIPAMSSNSMANLATWFVSLLAMLIF